MDGIELVEGRGIIPARLLGHLLAVGRPVSVDRLGRFVPDDLVRR